ncbi:MAG: hypothetical protein CME62_05325 [Halobacteriovoraceae bacterium]|nr:hypothetical protein [Halobacteriovoraceae bacterium]|tara:strand:+ start:34417 stop:35079 length:663 start_codon:yes stop_codon:yes gene_type:complete
MNLSLSSLILICIISANSLFAAQDDWVVISKKDGITVYSKKSKNTAIRSMRAHGIVNAPISKITAILRNVEAAGSWVPNLVERKYVKNISDTEAILYDITDMPWPVNDRDTVVHYKLKLSEDKRSLILYFKSTEHPNAPAGEGKVRAEIEFGKIYFSPRGEDTYVELILLVDPKGSIPTWAVNLVQSSMPYDFIMSLSEFASKTKLTCPEGIKELIDQMI